MFVIFGLELEFGFQMNLVLELLDVVLLCIFFKFPQFILGVQRIYCEFVFTDIFLLSGKFHDLKIAHFTALDFSSVADFSIFQRFS